MCAGTCLAQVCQSRLVCVQGALCVCACLCPLCVHVCGGVHRSVCMHMYFIFVGGGQHTHVPLHMVCMCRCGGGTSHLCVQARVVFPPLLSKAPFSHRSSFFLYAGVFLQNNLVSSLPFGTAFGRCIC